MHVPFHTLLYWILLISSEDWGSPGNCCFNRSKIVSALSSKSSLFSKLTAEPHADFPSLWCIFLFHITIDASILFLRSRTLCSVVISMVERNWRGSKNSIVMLLYIKSPRLDLPFYMKARYQCFPINKFFVFFECKFVCSSNLGEGFNIAVRYLHIWECLSVYRHGSF